MLPSASCVVMSTFCYRLSRKITSVLLINLTKKPHPLWTSHAVRCCSLLPSSKSPSPSSPSPKSPLSPDMVIEDKPYNTNEEDEEEEAFANRVFEEVTIDMYTNLIQNEDDRKKIDEILADYEFAKYTTNRVPTTIMEKHMKEMMTLNTPSARNHYFNYMFKTEMAKLAQKRLKEKKRMEREEKEKDQRVYPPGQLFDENNRPIYRKWHNSFFLRIPDRQMDQAHDYKKRVSSMFGQKLIVDLGFEDTMVKREIINACDQLAESYGLNYRYQDPFDLWFCNHNPGSFMDTMLHKQIPNLEFPNTMISLDKRGYLDIVPKEKLIFLTPHSKESYSKFNEDDVIIIGAIVDKLIKKPVSFAKAKRDNIRMARLPIDEHVVWGSASKTLTINQILGILLEVKANGGDWKGAFLKFIPKRKLKSPEDIAMEEEVRLNKLTRKRKSFFKIHH